MFSFLDVVYASELVIIVALIAFVAYIFYSLNLFRKG